MKILDYQTYYDKVMGGWVGKSAGGLLGAHNEGYKRFNEANLLEEPFKQDIPNDDLNLQILWLDMVKKKGATVRETDFAEHWKNHVRFTRAEYGITYRNLKLGIYPPQSGEHNNWYWQSGMGSPIRSEIWGMLNPGMPHQAAFYAGMDSCLDHAGFPVEAEQFLSTMVSTAFFESNPQNLLHIASHCLAPDNSFQEMLTFIQDLRKSCSFENAIGKFKSCYGDADYSNARMNVGFALLILLFHDIKSPYSLV